jgi:hypothetical protein
MLKLTNVLTGIPGRRINSVVCSCLLAAALAGTAGATGSGYTISRTTLPFGNVAVGMSVEAGFAITATSNTLVTISSATLSGSGFQFAAGIFPYTLGVKGASFSWAYNFVPTAAQTYSGTATFIINNEPVNIMLTGTGITTTAVATPSVRSLSFTGSQGTQSRAQSVTITNTGASTVNILAVTTQQPFTTLPVKETPLVAGAQATFSVNYYNTNVGTITGDLLITYDVLPATGISLIGTTTAPLKFAITNNPTLPLGSAGYPYLAQLNTVKGTGAVTWALARGPNLPSGLTLSSTGLISGTFPSTVTLNTYTFSVTATDSASHTTSLVMSLPVLAPNGAACNNISWDIGGAINPIIPISDLGTGNYFGTEGGLYGGGSNTPPPQHDADGVAFAKQVQPLDANGNPNSGGKIGMIGFGISTLLYEMNAFVPMATADLATNSHVVIVNGGEATAGAPEFATITSPFWTTLVQNLVPNAGITPAQVQAVFFEDIDQSPTGTFPSDQVELQGELEEVAQNVLVQFPNIKLMYLVSRIYSGYSVSNADPEPYAYEQGFAIQGALLDQINGLPSLNYNPANGPVMAPWIGYGPYTWANGMIARSDGLTYDCQDVRPDGHHPSVLYGAPKAAAQFLNFFKTNDTTAPWFVAPVGAAK